MSGMTWPEMQKKLNAFSKVDVNHIEVDLSPPDESLLLDDEMKMLNSLPLEELRELVSDEEAMLYAIKTAEKLGLKDLSAVLHRSHEEHLKLFYDVMGAVSRKTLQEKLYFKEPIEHTKYCALNTMRILRSVDQKIREIAKRRMNGKTQ